jgi:adenosyl cobinamide kinase/adenosyl cobinamide phosphate guanylyltransferase
MRGRALPDKGRLVLVLGGARSGKSAHAEKRIEAQPPPWTYLATAPYTGPGATDAGRRTMRRSIWSVR